MDTYFTSNENKAMLWNLMCDNGLFNEVSSEYVQTIKELFENEISNADKNLSKTGNVVTKNKRVLSKMKENVNQIPKNHEYPVTARDAQKERQEQFENNLALRQTEFNQMIAKPVPKQLDFSDKADAPITGDIDKILSDVISKRDNDLKNITVATGNIATSDIATGNTETSKDRNKLLKIGETIIQDNQTDKQVSFNEIVNEIPSSHSTDNKPKNDITNEEISNTLQNILEQLKVINGTQEKIHNMLNKK